MSDHAPGRFGSAPPSLPAATPCPSRGAPTLETDGPAPAGGGPAGRDRDAPSAGPTRAHSRTPSGRAGQDTLVGTGGQALRLDRAADRGVDDQLQQGEPVLGRRLRGHGVTGGVGQPHRQSAESRAAGSGGRIEARTASATRPSSSAEVMRSTQRSRRAVTRCSREVRSAAAISVPSSSRVTVDPDATMERSSRRATSLPAARAAEARSFQVAKFIGGGALRPGPAGARG